MLSSHCLHCCQVSDINTQSECDSQGVWITLPDSDNISNPRRIETAFFFGEENNVCPPLLGSYEFSQIL